MGASVCASGSQVWNGQTGTLTAKAITNAQKAIALTVGTLNPSGRFISVMLGHCAKSTVMSNVPITTPINWVASSKPNEPPMV